MNDSAEWPTNKLPLWPWARKASSSITKGPPHRFNTLRSLVPHPTWWERCRDCGFPSTGQIFHRAAMNLNGCMSDSTDCATYYYFFNWIFLVLNFISWSFEEVYTSYILFLNGWASCFDTLSLLVTHPGLYIWDPHYLSVSGSATLFTTTVFFKTHSNTCCFTAK